MKGQMIFKILAVDKIVPVKMYNKACLHCSGGNI